MYSKDIKILIVDDMVTMRKYILKKLKILGFYNFLEASNGKDALDLLINNNQQIDLITTDINMPEMTGIELVKNAKQTNSLKNIPFIIISSEKEHQSLENAISAGAEGYLYKPFNENNLKIELQNVLVKKLSLSSRCNLNSEKKNITLNTLDALFNPISDSIKNTITNQCKTTIKSKMFYKQDFENDWKPEKGSQIVSNSFLSDGNQHCSLSLYFNNTTFLKLASMMFEEEIQEITPSNRDLIAEWLNIALGNLKHELNDKMGCNFKNSIPVIVIGNQLITQSTKKNPLFIFPYSSDYGNFHLLLSVGEERIIPWDKSLFSM